MKQSPSLNFHEEIEKQLLIGADLEKYHARHFLNVLSEMILKYDQASCEQQQNQLGA
ncbi:hypothetical protein [Lysinibacillus sp. FSL K6-4013]|uniref:hypothetical protein n=1 Tax=Lysinibacillus sp. FSL K6-4013 TaxID=2921504 RepID=UPI00315AC206